MDLNSRRQNFKKGFDADEVRRQREEDEVLVRKNEKAGLLAKKRQMTESVGAGADAVKDDATGEENSMVGAGMSELASMIRNRGPQLLNAVVEIRKRLSKRNDPPIKEVIEADIVPSLVQLLAQETDVEQPKEHKLKFEVAWALTNVASGTKPQTMAVVKAGGLDACLMTLNSKAALKWDLCEQCVWAMGNIAGDGPELRDALLKANVMGILQNICSAIAQLQWEDREKTSVLRNVMWLMSNLCRGKPSPPFEVVSPAFDVFAEVVGRNLDKEMVIDAMWGLSYLTSSNTEQDDNIRCRALLLAGQDTKAEIKMESNLLLQCLLNHLKIESAPDYAETLRTPAIRIIGNVVSASDPQLTDVCVMSGLLPVLVRFLSDGEVSTKHRKEAAWIISNIAAGTPHQVLKLCEPIIGTQDTFDVLKNEIQAGQQFAVKKECAWAFANAITAGGELIDYLVLQKDFLKMVKDSLDSANDSKLTAVLLDALTSTLVHADEKYQPQAGSSNEYVRKAEECGLEETLRSMDDVERRDGNTDIGLKANSILKRWFEQSQQPDTAAAADTPFGSNVRQHFNFGN